MLMILILYVYVLNMISEYEKIFTSEPVAYEIVMFQFEKTMIIAVNASWNGFRKRQTANKFFLFLNMF